MVKTLDPEAESHPSPAVTDPGWLEHGAPFKEVNLEKLEGRNLASKIDMLMAHLSMQWPRGISAGQFIWKTQQLGGPGRSVPGQWDQHVDGASLHTVPGGFPTSWCILKAQQLGENGLKGCNLPQNEERVSSLHPWWSAVCQCYLQHVFAAQPFGETKSSDLPSQRDTQCFSLCRECALS